MQNVLWIFLEMCLARRENIGSAEIIKIVLNIAKQTGDPGELLKEEKLKALIYNYLEYAEE